MSQNYIFYLKFFDAMQTQILASDIFCGLSSCQLHCVAGIVKREHITFFTMLIF